MGQLINSTALPLKKQAAGQLMSNALARLAAGKGEIFFLSAVGKGITAFPVWDNGVVSSEGTFLSPTEIVDIIHPDDLGVEVRWV